MRGNQSPMGKALEFRPHKMRPRDVIAHTDHGMYTVSSGHALHYTSKEGDMKKLGAFGSRNEAIGHANAHHASIGKALDWGPDGNNIIAEPHHGSYDVVPKRGGSAKLIYHPKTGSTPRPRHDLGVHRNVAAAQAVAERHHASVGKSSGFELVSLDDYYELMKDMNPEKVRAYHADAAQRMAPDPKRTMHVDRPPPAVSDVASRLQNERRVTKFPRRPKPTVRMKPITNEEAMEHIRSGTYSANKQKSMRWLTALKALATGYGRTSGGGALKAANREAPYLGPDGRPGRADPRYRRRSRSGKPRLGPDGRPGRADGRRLRRSVGDLDLDLDLEDLNRAAELMPVPSGPAKPPSVYLPGTHNPKSPVRRAPGLKKPSTKKPGQAINASMRPSTSSARSPGVLDGGGATELSNSLEDEMAKAEHSFKHGDLVVHNPSADPKDRGTIGAVGLRSTATHVHFKTAGGAPKMVHHSEVRAATADDVKYHRSAVDKLHGLGFTKGISVAKINFNDIFKSELATPDDEVLTDCPHCEVPITKGDLAKAHKGKGKTTHVSGPKHGKSSAHVRDHNPEGGTMRGGDGRGVHTPSRGVPGAKKTDENHVQSAGKSKGKLPGVSKAGPDRDDDSSSGEADSGDTMSKGGDGARTAAEPVKKSVITIRGTEHVYWYDDGSDARLAKAILEGSLGGTPPTQPMDLNNDASRLLI